MLKKNDDEYLKNVDGLRFIGFLSIFFFHSFHTSQEWINSSDLYQFVKWSVFGNGNLGVNFFFVLSGFLITRILHSEITKTGSIGLINFYLKKVLRICPLFFFCIVFGFIIFPAVKSMLGQEPNESANVFSYLLFINNFDIIVNGLPDASVLGVLWCIAVEAQFYLVWPILLLLIPQRHYLLAFSVLVILSVVFRMYFDNRMFFEFHSITCLGDIAIGATGAILITNAKIFKTIKEMPRLMIIVIYFLAIAFYFFRDETMTSHYWLRGLERPLIAIIFLLIILEQNFSHNSFYKISRWRTGSELGAISYGLYCLHFIGILSATTLFRIFSIDFGLWQVLLFETVLALIISVILAKLSFRFFEKPFLDMKSKIMMSTARN